MTGEIWFALWLLAMSNFGIQGEPEAAFPTKDRCEAAGEFAIKGLDHEQAEAKGVKLKVACLPIEIKPMAPAAEDEPHEKPNS
jgi:hypothetical protein